MALYIFHCERCGEYVDYSFVEANNKKEAERMMDDAIHEHELTYHHDNNCWPKGKVIRLVPFRRKKRAR